MLWLTCCLQAPSHIISHWKLNIAGGQCKLRLDFFLSFFLLLRLNQNKFYFKFMLYVTSFFPPQIFMLFFPLVWFDVLGWAPNAQFTDTRAKKPLFKACIDSLSYAVGSKMRANECLWVCHFYSVSFQSATLFDSRRTCWWWPRWTDLKSINRALCTSDWHSVEED